MEFVRIVMSKLFIIIALSCVNFLYAKINIVVSILPQKTFVEAIGKEKVNVTVMVKPGNSPHTYEPKASQMKDIAQAKLYFSIGVEFENSWLSKFSNQNKNMLIKDVSQGIIKHTKPKLDPHIWTSPANVKIIALNIYNHLVLIDNKNQVYYKENLNQFLDDIAKIDIKIKENLKDVPNGSKFMVFHPAWGYFAKEYNLIQLAIELEGKSPKPKNLIYLIEEAKKDNIKAIFTQPEFSPKIANIMAKELNIKVIKTTPLHPNWGKNLLNLSEAISGNH
jgi:zinc transport system substrate-binding protein